MVEILAEFDNAKKHLKLADHMLTMTYPVVNDPKLLLSVIENLNLTFSSAISAVLMYERDLRQIPPYHDTIDGRLDFFKNKSAEKFNISPNYIKMIEEIKDLVQEHKESPIEFSKKNEYVICSDEFKRLKTINIKEMKEYIAKAKLFIAEISNIIEAKK